MKFCQSRAGEILNLRPIKCDAKMKSFIKLFLFFVILCNSLFSGWYDYPKVILGNFTPLSNKPPYAQMSNLGNGLWAYSNYFVPGVNIDIKFGVKTNINSNYLLELIKPFNLTIPAGYNNNLYYLTNKDSYGNPINIVKVREGNPNNRFVELEFNFEGAPDPPTGIVATPYSKKIKLNWTKSVELDVVGYNVYMSNKFLPFYLKMNSTTIISNSFTITNLPDGVTNKFYITSVDAYTNMPNNESEPSSVVQAIAGKPVTVLIYCKMNKDFVPGGLHIAGEPSPLNWNGIKMEYLYNKIWRYKATFPEFTTIKYKFKYTDKTNIWEKDFNTTSKNREIKIVDYDNDGLVVINNIWNMEELINPAPLPPANIIALPGNSNVRLRWSKNKELDIKSYKIYRSNFNTNFHLIAETELTNYIDTGLLNNTNYYYRLKSVDHSGNESQFSPIIIATPSTNPKPIKPAGLKAYAGNSNVVLIWQPNPEADIKGYVIYRSNNSNPFTQIAFTNLTSYTDKNLNNGTTYYYKLRAVDTISQTNDGFSEIVSATPSTNPPPSRPTGLQLLFAGVNYIVIGWNPNPNFEKVSGYRIYYGTNSLSYSNFTTQTKCTLSNLVTGKKYQIALKAISSNQMSELSDIIYAYPVATITDLTAFPNGKETGSVLLNFTAPQSSGELGNALRYIVKYSTNKINNLIDFNNAKFFGEFNANSPQTLETINVNNLGTGCPGYYFVVATLYKDEIAVGLSKSVYSVAAETLSTYFGKTISKISEKTKIVIPANSLPAEVSAIVIKNRNDLLKEENPDLEKISIAFQNANSYPYVKVLSDQLFYQIYAINSASEKVELKNRVSDLIRVYLPFNDSDHNEIVDNTLLNVNDLRLYRLNEDINQFAFIERSVVNKIDNVVYGYVNNLGIFTILANVPPVNLERVVTYPNPAIKPSSENPVIFKNLTPGAKIKIYNINGELVKDNLKADSYGLCIWDALNDANSPVSSGLYIYYIEDDKGNTKKGKLAIVR